MKTRFFTGLTLSLALSALAFSQDAPEPNKIVFDGNRMLALDAVKAEGDNFIVQTDQENFKKGQSFPIALASHVSGQKPAAINEAIGLLLLGKAPDAIIAIEPVLAEHRPTAKIPGNYWLEAARAALVAYALSGSSSKCDSIGKEISDATPAPGNDPSIALGRALLTPLTVKLDDRAAVLAELVNDTSPPEVSAYASYFRANLLKTARRENEALDAYLIVPCVYPTGGRVINGAAEMNAGTILSGLEDRREEAVMLLNSAVREARGTATGVEAEKRLKNVQ